MNDGIERGQSPRRAAFQIAIDGLSAQLPHPFSGRGRAHKREDLMACRYECGEQATAEKAGASRDDDSHGRSLVSAGVP
ncbi:hypothetical protein [Paraburkholderia sp. JHI869]|uniref:hypothetical protein n=1 Tax=Paraburkholderia sp. JHI869 TaxID=3112959 RepID=UPI003177DCA8